MIRAGILGGGQLGRMLLQAAINYPVVTHVLENDPQCPAAHLCHSFTLGDIRSFHDVLAFGRELDVITIEIEQVNLEALEQLEQAGVRIIPRPAALRKLRSKIDQKQFYQQQQLPTAPFHVTQSRADLPALTNFLPAVHKIAEGGYDGRGVQLLTQANDFPLGFNAPAVLESLVDFEKEISVIVAAGHDGQCVSYPPVEMVADPNLNQLDYQLAPANMPLNQAENARAIAEKLVAGLASPGLFAVELFLTKSGEILINETAPRVHNSGHHTIEAAYCSQFDMVWRLLLQLPLGDTRLHHPSVMINLVGAPNHQGPVHYQGLPALAQTPGAFLHVYGKQETRPGRKMGHITLLGSTVEALSAAIHQLKQQVKVEASQP